jgi:hypothetical protein
MATKPTERLHSLFQSHVELDKEVCSTMVSLYDRKLWHELSLKLKELFKAPDYLPYIQELFEGFIVDFGHKMNLLYFAQFAHDVAKSMDRDAAVALLTKHADGLRALKGFPTKEPLLFLDMSIAEHFIDVAHMDECKERLDQGLGQLESMSDVRSCPTSTWRGATTLQNLTLCKPNWGRLQHVPHGMGVQRDQCMYICMYIHKDWASNDM